MTTDIAPKVAMEYLLRFHLKGTPSDSTPFLRLAKGYLLSRCYHELEAAYREQRLSVEHQVWSWQDIERLVPTHDACNPTNPDVPIVVAYVAGVAIIVDGNKRRNLWVLEGRKECPVLFVTISGEVSGDD